MRPHRTRRVETFGSGRTVWLYTARPAAPRRFTVVLTPLVVLVLAVLVGAECAWRGAGAAEGDAGPGAEATSGPVLVVAPVPTVTPAPAYTATAEPVRVAPSSRGERSAGLRALFEQYDWSVDTAMAVSWCESRLDANAVNGSSGAAGLMQLLPDWGLLARRLFGYRVSLLDPAVNLRVAYTLYQDSGERFGFHWAASVGCWGNSGW